jgi:hypothetical protein
MSDCALAETVSVTVGGDTTDIDFQINGDGCPNDPEKSAPGECGCGNLDTDTDGDGTADCNDACDDDPYKFEEGICGCGLGDLDLDGDTIVDCVDNCPGIPNTDQTPCAGDDQDGIAPEIDGEWKNGSFTNEDGKWSNNFSDSEIATTKVVTYGTIVARNALTFIVADAVELDDGVSVNVTTTDADSTNEAELTICTYNLLVSRGDSFVATCRMDLIAKEGSKDALAKNTGNDTFVVQALYGVVKVKLGSEGFVEIPLGGEVTIQETSKGTFEIENASTIPVTVITHEGEQTLEPQEIVSVDATKFPWAMFLPAFTGNAANK